MRKTELIVLSDPDDAFLTGGCSSCPDVRFKLMGNTLEHKQLLRRMFDTHFRKVHVREVESQIATPILKKLPKITDAAGLNGLLAISRHP